MIHLLSSDGRCTGMPNGFGNLDWAACCIAHDLGGTDGQLLDCLMNATPAYLWSLMSLAVTIMVVCRPIYNFMQERGWVK